MIWLTRRRRLAGLGLLPLVLCAPSSARAAGGERPLGPAAAYLSFKPQAAYDLLEEIRKLLPKKLRLALPMVSLGLSRALGFDPLSPAWMETAGVDPAAPIWASLLSLDPVGARARLGRVDQAARRHLAGASKAEAFKPSEVGGPLAWIRHRLALKLRDEARAPSALRALGDALGSRAVLLAGRGRSEVSPGLGSLLGLTAAQAEPLAAGLIAQKVLLVCRPDRNLLALFRVSDGTLLVDLLSEVMGLPEKPGAELRPGLLAALSLPGRHALEPGGKGLARRVFSDDASLSVLLLARPLLAAASELDAVDTLRASWFGASLEGYSRKLKEAQVSRKTFAPGSVPVGDLGLQVRGDAKGVRVRLIWAAPTTVARAFAASAASRDLVDVTEWQPKVVGLAGLGVELGPLLRALPRGGPFKLPWRTLEARSRACPALSGATVLLGGWAGLLGQVKAELRADEQAALLLDHARSAVLLLRDLSSLGRPGLIAQLAVAPTGAARLKDSVGKLAHESRRPESQTIGGYPTTIYSSLRPPLGAYSLAITDLQRDGLTLTLSGSRWELLSFLGQKPPAARVLPPRVLAFAHAQLPKLLTSLQNDRSFRPAGKLLRDLAARVDDLGANLSLSEETLLAEIHLGLKPP